MTDGLHQTGKEILLVSPLQPVYAKKCWIPINLCMCFSLCDSNLAELKFGETSSCVFLVDKFLWLRLLASFSPTGCNQQLM